MHPRTVYYLFQLFTMLGMTCVVTVYTPFLFSIGLSVSDIALLNVGFWGIIVVSEIPTGLFADARSRAWSLKVGTLLLAVGELTYFSAQGFGSALLAELISGFGSAFLSGAQQAWITDALWRRGEQGSLRKVFATGAVWKGVGALLGGMLGAGIGAYWLRAGWLLNALFMACAFVVLAIGAKSNGEPLVRVGEWEAMKQSVKLLKTRASLRWAAAVAMIFGLIVPFNHFWVPIFQSYVGQAKLGLLWILIYSTLVLAGLGVRKLAHAHHKEAELVVAALLFCGVSLIGIGLGSALGIAVLWLVIHELGRGAFEPLLDSFIQHRVESSYRATYGSLQSLIGRAGFVATLFGAWLITRGLPSTLTVMKAVLFTVGVLIVMLGVVLWLWRAKGDIAHTK